MSVLQYVVVVFFFSPCYNVHIVDSIKKVVIFIESNLMCLQVSNKMTCCFDVSLEK